MAPPPRATTRDRPPPLSTTTTTNRGTTTNSKSMATASATTTAAAAAAAAVHDSPFLQNMGTLKHDLYALITNEIYAVVTWSVSSCLFRLLLSSLVILASHRKTSTAEEEGEEEAMASGEKTNGGSRWRWFCDAMAEETLMTAAIFAGWALSLVPRKVAGGMAPGFVYASTWLLLPIHDKFGSIPNIPTRICEMVLGRITPRELAVILPIHFLGAIFGALLVRKSLPSMVAIHAVDTISYSEGNPFLVDFVRETVINAAFTVSILVIPELLKLNKFPRMCSIFFWYPIYSYGVDAVGRASTFGPDVIYALRCVSRHEEVPLGQSSHMLGPIVGGLIGGKIMTIFFPDENYV